MPTKAECRGKATKGFIHQIKSANWHFTSSCNYRCKFCCAKNLSGDLKSPEMLLSVLEQLNCLGISKINFVGGEPLCNSLIYRAVEISKELGFTTSITTNGSLLNEKSLEKLIPNIDWIGLSIDSYSEEIEKELGRGDGDHVKHVSEISKMIRNHGIKLKINTTVTKKNYTEYLGDLIEQLSPDRWKVFQVMHVPGQNDSCLEELLISDTEFAQYVEHHSQISLTNGERPVFEFASDMIDSYFMISPSGNAFVNNCYPFKEVPLETITQENLSSLFDTEKYFLRGAIYAWKQ
jgi:radical S-adenosyl methionine domain-containing protein 2